MASTSASASGTGPNPSEPFGLVGLKKGGSDTLYESKVAVGNTWKNLATRAKVERRKLYEDALDQLSFKAKLGLKAPQTKNLDECPSSMVDGKLKAWKAYEYPSETKDDIIKTQFSIKRKDYMGKPRELFCYPDQFDGVKFDEEDDNPAVDMSLYTYVSPSEVSKSLEELSELLMPNKESHEAEKRRIAVTDTIVRFQNDTDLINFKKTTVDDIAQIYAASSVLTGGSKLKLKRAKSKVKQWVDTVASIAQLNMGLETPRCVDGPLKRKQVNNVTIEYCFPTALMDEIRDDPNLLSSEAKKAIKKKLNQFAIDYVQKMEAQKEFDEDEAYIRIRQQQTNPSKI